MPGEAFAERSSPVGYSDLGVPWCPSEFLPSLDQEFGFLSRRDRSECAAHYSLGGTPYGHSATLSGPHLHKLCLFCVWDPVLTCLPKCTVNEQDSERGEGTLEATVIWTIGSFIPILRLIRKFLSLCEDLWEGTAMVHRKRWYVGADPSGPSAWERRRQRAETGVSQAVSVSA